LVNEKFGVELSEDQIRRILRNKLAMHFSKPYPKDYRRSKDAEEILAGNLETTIRLLEEKGIKDEDISIGFLDESSPQLTANTVRVWSFEKPNIQRNTEKMKSNTIGFYAIKGKSIVGFLERSKTENIMEFLEKIKDENKKYKAIVIVLDNFSSHRKKLREKIEGFGIYFLYLPPYSPDLNKNRIVMEKYKKSAFP